MFFRLKRSCVVRQGQIELRIMRLWQRATNKSLILSLLSLSSFLLSSAYARYDIARNDFTENTYVGPSVLDEAHIAEWNWADSDEEMAELVNHQKTNLFSTRIDLSAMGIKSFVVPDVNYPVLFERDSEGNIQFSNAKNSMGLNLIPVGSEAPVFRITDENRVKFQERLVDEDGRELGRTVDEATFDRITQEVAEERRANAPLLTIRDFDDGEKPGIASTVKTELSAEGMTFNEVVYNKITKGLRDKIAELPGAGEFNQEWFATTYETVVNESDIRNTLTDDQMTAIFAQQKAQMLEYNGEDFSPVIFDAMAAKYIANMKAEQAAGRELNPAVLSTAAQQWCANTYGIEEEQQKCTNYSYYVRWSIDELLPKTYATGTLAYSYERAVNNRRFNEDEFWNAVWAHREIVAEPNPNSVSVKVVDRMIRQSMFPDAGPDDTRHMYAIVGHTASNEAIYKDLQSLTSVKVQTSIHHVSAYYGANGYTRRGFLEGGQPNNIYTVTVKGVDQEAVNLNNKIWAKIYYENPNDHYQFSDDYEFDEFENTTLKRVLDFGRAWIDKEWVNQPLNAKFVKYAREMNLGLSPAELAERKNKPYYKWLLEDPVFGLYCFEGVTNQLNVSLNIPLTEKYMQRIYGEEEGTKLFNLVNDRWLQVLLNEGIPGEKNADGTYTGEVANFHLKKLEHILGKMKPLWDLKGTLTNPAQFTAANPLAPNLDEEGKVLEFTPNPVRDSEYNKVGNSLAWVPQTTGDIVADLIEMYVPFHKTKALVSTAVILNFQTEHERRTGISKKTYLGYALPIISEMFKAEASLMLKELPQGAPIEAAKAVYVAKNKEGLTQMLSKPDDEGNAPTAAQVAQKVEAIMPAIQAGVTASVAIPTEDIVAAGGDAKYAAWLNFKKAAKPVLAKANQTPVQITDAVLAHMQDKKFVKFYTRPGLLQSMVAGSWPTNPHILLRSVGTVINESWTKLAVPGTDLPNYDYREKEQFVRDFAEQAQQFRTQEVKDEALKAHAARLYDGKVIGIEDSTSNDAERRVRAAVAPRQ